MPKEANLTLKFILSNPWQKISEIIEEADTSKQLKEQNIHLKKVKFGKECWGGGFSNEFEIFHSKIFVVFD